MKESVCPTRLTPDRKAHIYVLGGAICISFASLFVKEAAMEPAMVAFYRLLFGGLSLLGVAVLRGERWIPSRSMLRVLVVVAFCFSSDLIAWHECIVRLGPGLATILVNFQVFFLALWGAFVLGEKLSLGHKLAIPLAIAGLMLLLEVNPAKLPPHIFAGLVFGLVAALFYSAYILTLRQSQSMEEKLPATANMAIVSLFSMLLVGTYCFVRGDSFVIPDARSFGLLVFLGVGCQALGWVLLSTGLPKMPASRAGLVMLIQPTFSFLWDLLFYSRPTGVLGFLGAAVTLGAIGMGLGLGKKSVPEQEKTPQKSTLANEPDKMP